MFVIRRRFYLPGETIAFFGTRNKVAIIVIRQLVDFFLREFEKIFFFTGFLEDVALTSSSDASISVPIAHPILRSSIARNRESSE